MQPLSIKSRWPWITVPKRGRPCFPVALRTPTPDAHHQGRTIADVRQRNAKMRPDYWWCLHTIQEICHGSPFSIFSRFWCPCSQFLLGRYDPQAFKFDRMKEEVADAMKEDRKRVSLPCLLVGQTRFHVWCDGPALDNHRNLTSESFWWL